MKRNYESMVILEPDISDQEKEEIFNKIIKKIEELQGQVLATKIWDRERNFYYFLRGRGAEKKKYYKGCYWLVNFALDIDKMPDLKETIRLEERILRSLIINRQNYSQPTLGEKPKRR